MCIRDRGAHRHHHCRHREQKHGLADRYFPVGAPAQQPEADDEQRDEQEVRFHVQHAAHQGCKRDLGIFVRFFISQTVKKR